jgi:hypothetical protein
VVLSAALFAMGLALGATLVVAYVSQNLRLTLESPANYVGVTGLMFMILGFNTFTCTLLLHSTAVAVWRKPDS